MTRWTSPFTPRDGSCQDPVNRAIIDPASPVNGRAVCALKSRWAETCKSLARGKEPTAFAGRTRIKRRYPENALSW